MLTLETVPVPPRIAPVFTVTPLDAAMLPVTESVPPLTVVAPAYVLVPDSVNVPVPVLVRLVVAPWIAPLKVVELLSPPVVSVAAVTLVLVTLPAPASEPIDELKPLRSSVAKAPTVNALADENPVCDPARRVPALTLVAPAYVLLPERMSAPLPVLPNPPLPPIGPESVIVFAWVSIVLTPLSEIVFAITRLFAAAWNVAASATVSVPVLSALFDPTARTPLL